ncbi:signal peptide peptidase SppA [Oxalobacter sp. OttesenSCG-928-P03]|nr:signal peptide peptidase SppA [Oxalobacter sp. OttesenSCG-928-P03]
MENTNDTTSPAETAATVSGKEVAWEREIIEKMLTATLKEQRAKRRWGIFFKFLAVAVVIILFGVARTVDFSSDEGAPVEGSHAALIKISGVISSETRASAEKITKSLQKAFSEKNVTGIILRINSPGGSPVQAGRIHDEIIRLRQLYPGKPVHVVVEEVCASGGYYIAAAAENVYVDKASIVGSIGVLVNGFGFTGLMEKVGIERRLMTSGKNKAFMDPFSPQNEQQKQYVQSLIDEVHQQFIAVVKNGRGNRLKSDDDIFSGLVWTGTKAIELGLADGLGTVNSVARDVIKTQTIVDYTEEEKLSDRVLKKLGASMGEGAARYSSQELLPALK